MANSRSTPPRRACHGPVLVLDSDIGAREHARLCLARRGLAFLAAWHERQAQHLATLQRPGAVLVGLASPARRRQMLRWLRAMPALATVPVIAYTGAAFASPPAPGADGAEGFDGRIDKPARQAQFDAEFDRLGLPPFVTVVDGEGLLEGGAP